MPELPEVEHVRRGLASSLPGQRLRDIEFKRRDLRWPIPIAALRRAVGERLDGVRRRGKWLSLDFAGRGGSALVHLGMSGRVVVAHGPETPDWDLHEHWRMSFDKATVRGIDPRRFGALDRHPTRAIHEHPRLAKLGPEPLDDDFDAATLRARAAGRKTSIKAYLLDGRNVAGVGNIYACEACFLAGVRPTRGVQRLRGPQWQALRDGIRETLQRAIDSGGTSLRDYVDATGTAGKHQFELFVYGREGEACRLCGTEIRSIRQQGRTSYFCPACQKS